MTDQNSTNPMLWALVALATLFFVILMVFAVTADNNDVPDSEITPAEGESGPDGEG